MRAHVKAAEPFVREDVTGREARERFVAEAPGLQGRADRRPRRAAESGTAALAADRLALHQRPVHRPLPRPARAEHQVDRRVQAAVGRRRLLARRLAAHDADAHLRHGVLLQGGAAAAPRAPRAGAGARPPQARARARPVHVLRALARAARSGSPPARRSATRWSSCGARMNAERGYSEVKTPQLYDAELWKTVRPLGQVPRQHVSRDVEERPMGAQADELPRPLPALHDERHSYRDLPVRYSEPGLLHRNEASRRAARPAARAPLRPGRRAHLLHRGAGPGGGRAAACEFGVRTCTSCSASSRASSSRRAPSSASATTSCGTAPRGRWRGALRRRGPGVRAEPRRRRLLRAEDRHAHDRLARALLAARARSSSTTRCPSAST